MTDLWSDRAQAYRDSDAHRGGDDLDQVVAWALAAEGREALDVGTGGKHVARRLGEAGFRVVTVDPAPGMQADVLCRAEDLPFASASFDVVACRVAAHHFDDMPRAVSEMARVCRGLVIVVDNEYMDDDAEQAEVLRDPSHVRNYTEDEWRDFFAAAGLETVDVRHYAKAIALDEWLERTGCTGPDAVRVRELLRPHVEGNELTLARIALLGRRAG